MFGHREKKLLRKALSLYAGEHIVSRVLRDGDRFLAPNVEPAVLTMLFFRHSFRAVNDATGHETMFEWQCAYAEAMTQTIAASSGTFDTFVGDDGSAWWNAKDQADHADHAVSCGFALLEAIENVNRQKPSFPQSALSIGIHTGNVALGNYGSKIWLRFCPMGDAVNVAARLRGPMSNVASPIIVSSDTYERLRNKEKLWELADLVKVTPNARVKVYGIRGNSGHAI